MKDKHFDKDFLELDELNEKFFYLCSRVNVYSSLMPPKIANYMAEKLFEQYKIAYTLFSTRKATKDGTELYELKKKKSVLVPFRFLFFRNKVGKITDKELNQQFNKMFSERMQKFEEK